MYESYEGMWQRTPEQIETTIWGNRETHENALGHTEIVQKNWCGSVTNVESSWF